MDKKKITAVVPCYNEEAVIELFYKEICRVAGELSLRADFEFMFVNDGSSDGTLKKMQELRREDKRDRKSVV